MTPQRKVILASYSKWTALSALRSGSPIRSKKDIYQIIDAINFAVVLDESTGEICKNEFEEWHKETIRDMVSTTPKLNKQYGWAAKIINIYLKTYCYIGGGGRKGICDFIHPPIDSGIWGGVMDKFNGHQLIADSHVVTRIKDISSHSIYLRIINGMRSASNELNCQLIEVEQLWKGAQTPLNSY